MEIKIDWYDYNGLSVRYGIRKGKKGTIPLLMFNGIGQNIEVLKPVIDKLPGIEVIIYDVPGAGLSDNPSYPWRYSCHAVLAAKLIKTLGYDQVNVLGLSWGGALAQQFSFQYPKKVNKMILVAACAGQAMIPGKLRAYMGMLSPRRLWDKDYMRKIIPHIYGGTAPSKRDEIDAHLERVRAPNNKGYISQCLALIGWSSLPWLNRIKQPTLILHGAQDPLIPACNAKIMAGLLPNSTLKFFKCGHMFILTKLDETAAHINNFVTEQPKC